MSEGPKTKPPEPHEERTQRLEAALAAVTARVFQLEREVAELRGVPPMPAAAAAPASTTARSQAQPAAAAESYAPLPKAAAAAAPTARVRDERSLESRVGSQWFNRIAIIALLIGVALFLKFAFDNH